MTKIPMTTRSHNQLQKELDHLKNTERANIATAIADARRHGDLSENAEYHAAKEKQRVMEDRIVSLEKKLSKAEIVSIQDPGNGTIVFGARITILDCDTNKELTYQIVGEDEADIKAGLLSIASPLARGLLGKTAGDDAEITTPGGTKEYEIRRVWYEAEKRADLRSQG